MPKHSNSVTKESTDLSLGLTDKAVCDDCGEAAQIVVSDLIARQCDVLCWGCLMRRAIVVAAEITPPEDGSELASAGVGT